MADRNIITQYQAGPSGSYRQVKAFGATINFLTTDLATGNTVTAFVVPKGFTVLGISALVVSALDTNGSPTLTISVGDAGSGTRYLNASAGLRAAAATVVALAATGVNYKNTADTNIVVTATAGAATAAAGQMILNLWGYLEN